MSNLTITRIHNNLITFTFPGCTGSVVLTGPNENDLCTPGINVIAAYHYDMSNPGGSCHIIEQNDEFWEAPDLEDPDFYEYCTQLRTYVRDWVIELGLED